MRRKIIQTVFLVFWLTYFLPAYAETRTHTSVDTPLSIPDDNPNGITSELEIIANGNVIDAVVSIDISHSYIGDLDIRLLCPGGEEELLQSRTGGNTDNINRSYQLSTCDGQMATGIWKLVISDHAALDRGIINHWELRLELALPGSNQAPHASAGVDMSALANQIVLLNGNASSDPDGDPLVFSWAQTSGPAILLDKQDSAQTTFLAPEFTKDTILTFELTVSDGTLNSEPNEMVVTILSGSSHWNQVQASKDTPLDIPDADTTGVSSNFIILASGSIVAGEVRVNISHTFIGDLRIQLHCPSGTETLLHNRNGGDTDNIVATFTLDACIGQSAKGIWRINVSDHAGQDIGSLNGWEVRLNLADDIPWDIDKTSTITPQDIPDNNSIGIISEIMVQSSGQALQAEVEVDINHTYISDLLLKLRCPNGVETVLHNRSGGSEDNIQTRYTITDCNNHSATGPWQLIISDHASIDTGTLESWTLRLKTDSNNSPQFQVEDIESWYLIGNDLTPGQDQLQIRVRANNYEGNVYAQVDNNTPVQLSVRDSLYSGLLNISRLDSGEHSLHLTSEEEVSITDLSFIRSHPLYVVVSNDWDSSDNADIVLSRQEQLHVDHPELKLTHFVGPYTFTDPNVSQARRTFLVEWLRNLRDNEGDEIGLHIHPYCNFVNTVEEVDCRHQPSYTRDEGDATGYTILSSAYSQTEYLLMLLKAKALFEANHLGTPVSFRAGGWTTDLGVMKALSEAGFVADSSANNWARLEEWENQQNGVLFDWNRQNWSSIGDTSQPYYPSPNNILISSRNALNVLEVPDNGSLVDYVSSAEMIEIFQSNWDGTALNRPIAYVIGYHPINYSSSYHNRIQQTLDHIDQYLSSQHQGPVVYETLKKLTQVWKK